jgi:hypothetical protein
MLFFAEYWYFYRLAPNVPLQLRYPTSAEQCTQTDDTA